MEEMVEAQEEVSSVVVLICCMISFSLRPKSHILRNEPYSFAKTPLKAAQAPLAAARGIQGSLELVELGLREGEEEGGIASGMRGSAAESMVGEGGRWGKLYIMYKMFYVQRCWRSQG